jgi:hypothetical protein
MPMRMSGQIQRFELIPDNVIVESHTMRKTWGVLPTPESRHFYT